MNYEELLHSPLLPASVIKLIQKSSHTHAPVFIQGENGTDKELIAKLIHHAGEWKIHRFYKMDCRILDEESFQRQLARLLEETRNGAVPATLYLREVGYLGQGGQSRLLELMEDGFFQNGAGRRILKTLRFISSFSENLKEKVNQGKFSEDLYDRLTTLSFHVPPLRERTGDIPAIAQYLLAEYTKRMKIRKTGISSRVLALLQSYWWPGNLKELEQVIVRSALFSEGETLTEKDLYFDTEAERNSFVDYLKKAEVRPTGSTRNHSVEEPGNQSLPLFFMELVHRVKNPLVSIKTFTQLLREKFDDVEFREYFYKIVTEDIEKIDSVLNGLVNYVKINTPLQKTNTIHYILEDVLKKHEAQLENKKIRVFKRFEKDLPEAIVHDEQLRYILSVLLEYALPSIPPKGSIGLLTKTSEPRKTVTNGRLVQLGNGRFVEILLVYTGYKKSAEQFESVLGVPAPPKEGEVELELRLVKEIIQKNRGVMRFEVNERKPRTLIALKFPMERRKVIYYQSTHV